MFSYDEIKELAQLVSDKNLGEIEVKSANGDSLVIKGKKEQVVAAPAAVQAAAPAEIKSQPIEEKAAPAAETPKVSGREIKSPIVGTFYSSADPSAEPFVKVGTEIKKGDVICIIEAMKIMNEVKADIDGTVKEMLVSNGDAVEYDQPLMIVE